MCVSCRSSATSRSTIHGAPSARDAEPANSSSVQSHVRHRNASFEHARPVGADERWVGGEPVVQLPLERVVEARLAGECVRPREEQPVLMPVELPDHFVVAGGGIEIGHRSPVRPRRAASMDHVLMPVRRRPRLETAMTEQVVAAVDDGIRARGRHFQRGGKCLTDRRGRRCHVGGVDRKGRTPPGEMTREGAMRLPVVAAPQRRPHRRPRRDQAALETRVKRRPLPGGARESRDRPSLQLAQLAERSEPELLRLHGSQPLQRAPDHTALVVGWLIAARLVTIPS